MSEKLSRDNYLSKHVGEFAGAIDFCNIRFVKVEDLRYGTNPHQTAAYYRPELPGCGSVIGGMQMLKSGKNGLSQTNLEDISYSLNIVKFFSGRKACAVMKHVNPSGVAMAAGENETLRDVYMKARDADARAAFGSVIAFNTKLDVETAKEIMSTFVECVVAPDFEDGVLDVFNDSTTYKLNRHVRVLRCGDLEQLPKFTGDNVEGFRTVKVLCDGSLVIADPLLTGLRSTADLVPASAESEKYGSYTSEISATPEQMNDLLFAWYVNLNVRSNGVVIAKDGQTLSVGTGEQDRVGAIEQAIAKFHQKYSGVNTLAGAVMASDGFFPFADGLETAAAAGISAIIAPAGSLRDAEVIKRANELGVAFYHASERIFSHH